MQGNMPTLGSSMTYKVIPKGLPGYEDYHSIQITYNIQNGIQGVGHQQPGKPFFAIGFPRTAFLPDSGYPPEVVVNCLQILDEHFGHTVNDKGFKVLNHVRIIQGDGITQDTIDRILYRAMTAEYSADNIAFGQGGKLLQGVDRDTQKFAMKCSSVQVEDEMRDVYKSPITDMDKESMKGRVTLYKNDEGYFTDLEGRTDAVEVLETVFENGKIIKEYTFDEVRKNASEIV